MFKIKDTYKLELQAMKLLGSTKKIIDKIKNREIMPSLEVVELVVVQCNLAGNWYQQNIELLYSFMPNKFYAYLLNIEPSNLVFSKTYNTEFDDITVTSTDKNGRWLEIEEKVNFTLLINK